MKSALSLTLIVCLVGWTLPVSAQEAFRETTQGPMTRATVSEAVRLALTQQNRPTAPSPKAGGSLLNLPYAKQRTSPRRLRDKSMQANGWCGRVSPWRGPVWR